MPGELAVDEVFLSPIDRYKTEVYFTVLDAIVMSISTRFDQSREILKDLCLLSPQRILKYSNGIIKTLPDDAFNEIENCCPTLPKQLHKNISKEQN
ncbi:hypothetical protein QTP88_011693 [Uroleucon formosanum]